MTMTMDMSSTARTETNSATSATSVTSTASGAIIVPNNGSSRSNSRTTQPIITEEKENNTKEMSEKQENIKKNMKKEEKNQINNNDKHKQKQDQDQQDQLHHLNNNNPNTNESLARAETRAINILRCVVLGVLVLTALIIGAGVVCVTKRIEYNTFQTVVNVDAYQVLKHFATHFQQNLEATAAMSSTITAYAVDHDVEFPFVTIPNFELLGSHARIQSGSHVLHYMPLISKENRLQWENYAMEHRSHIDVAFEQDAILRNQQDTEFTTTNTANRQLLQPQQGQQEPPKLNMTIAQDGTGYHERIWTAGGVDTAGDEPDGDDEDDYFLPLWQRRYVFFSVSVFINLRYSTSMFQY